MQNFYVYKFQYSKRTLGMLDYHVTLKFDT